MLFILGRMLGFLGMLLIVPMVCAIVYAESTLPFIFTIIICFALALALTCAPPKNRTLRSKEGFVCVGLSWIALSVAGALPFVFSGEIPNFADALFETVSGFTTTGASIVANVEGLSHSILLWRSLSQWIGGMGVLVLLLAILPRSDLKSSRFMHIMRAEVPGPTVGKVVPRIADTARLLTGIYILLTAVEIVLLCFGEMNLFEALTHSFSTTSTGGFGIKNDSIASYSAYSQYVVAVFMLLSGINMNVFFLIITGHFLKALKCEELWWYLAIVSAATTVICITTMGGGAEQTFRTSFFQVVSVLTTTGFSTADFGVWPYLAQGVLVTVMFFGGCAGCTAGGIKISRLLLLFKNARREVRYIAHPRAVISVKLEGKTVDHETVRGATSFILVYAAVFAVSTLALLAFDGRDLVTTFTAVTSAINNIGPGLAEVGPASNFALFSAPSKLVLCFDMLAGRLELFPMLILFSPWVWKKAS